MDLHDALVQVSEIRAQIARTETFRGYRAMTFGFSGLLVLVAATLQAILLPNPVAHMTAYLALWITAASIGLLVTVGSMAIRCQRSASPWTVRLTWIALEQFAPCVVAGALLTLSMAWYATESLWMLPGLWSILFSLGLFASSRLLPRPAVIVAGY